jgi:hypothetical protein
MELHIIGYCVACYRDVFNKSDLAGWHVVYGLSGVTYVCPKCVSALNLPPCQILLKIKRGGFHVDSSSEHNQH